ncbi:hypothetical protein LTR97_011257 [Elasticomyces elasticus]|uniref:NACHT domain-containing protein n=1 Tax=Elasticomyces elasticus TaxID=574655 RepID=A0AAN7ZR55_9PEZI|nr:hypothetical protein LTR97_011257 [Elasticomyces elasticus]
MGSYQDISHVTTGTLGITQVGTGNQLYLGGQTREAQRAAERAACLKAVCPIDPDDDLFELQRERKRSSGTCEWLLKSSKVAQWLLGHGKDVLWLTGPPGIGKTTLGVFLAEQILESKLSSKTLLHEMIPEAGCLLKKMSFAYFFCTEQQNHDNVVAVLQGLLLQLLRQDETLLDIARAAHQQSGSVCFGSVEGLWKILREALKNSSGTQLYFLVDALDLCHRDSRQTLFALLHQIADGCMSRTIRWVITSRTEEDIARAIGDGFYGERLELETGLVNNDLQHYLKLATDELGKARDYSPELKHRVQERLQANSEGTFLWVALVLKDLKRCTKAEVGELLKEALPTGLPGIYARILERIEPRRREHAIFLLQVVAAASHSRTVTELAAASLTRDATWHDVRHEQSSFEDPSDHGDAYEVLLPILYCDPVTKRARFIHQSVKDYLLRTPSTAETRGRSRHFNFSTQTAHHTMFTVCWRLCQIMDSAIRPSQSSTSTFTTADWYTRLVEYMRTHEHLTYFWDHMLEHAYASLERVLVTFPEEDLRKSPFLCDYWLQSAVSRNNTSITQRLLTFNIDACALMGSMTTSAMSISITRNDVQLMKRFLLHPRTKSSAYIYQALVVAIVEDKHDMVKLLLPRHQIAPTPDVAGPATVLRAASWHNRVEIFETILEQVGIDINEQDAGGHTVLMQAVAYERYKIIEVMLRTPGVDVNLRDLQGCSALSLAAKNCSGRMVELLLAHKDIDVNSKDREGNTPLAHAVLRNAIQVVQALLGDARLEMDTSDHEGRTPLMKAIASSHARIAKTLLETGRLQIGGEDRLGLTASAWAEAWCEEVPTKRNMLLEAGISPEPTSQRKVLEYEDWHWPPIVSSRRLDAFTKDSPSTQSSATSSPSYAFTFDSTSTQSSATSSPNYAVPGAFQASWSSDVSDPDFRSSRLFVNLVVGAALVQAVAIALPKLLYFLDVLGG